MRPKSITYYRPQSIEAAISVLSAQSIVLNGGQALVPTMRMRVVNPEALVDIKGIKELSDRVEVTEAGISIGPRVTVERFLAVDEIRREVAVLHEAGQRLADAQIRSQGTVVGSLCWADPRANYPVAMLACGAVIEARGRAGRREIAADDFFAGFRSNSLRNEIVTAVRLPSAKRFGYSAYREFSRQTNDVCLVNVAVAEVDRVFTVAVGGLDKRPRLAPAAAALLQNGGGGSGAFLSALHALGLNPVSDAFGSAEFKFRLASELLADIANESARGRS